MYSSEIRINYISDYISAYESKIKLLNSEGLFDAAKLFELFAIEVGSLYFGQQLKNLNIEKSNYPAVDLISEDKTNRYTYRYSKRYSEQNQVYS